jgi:hypothetical protein
MTTGDGSDAVPVGHGTIELTRVQEGYKDSLRGYTVLVDEGPVGTIRRGQTLRLPVPAGTHRLRLRIDWCSSAVGTVEVQPGAPSYFVCSPGSEASALAAISAGANGYNPRRSRCLVPDRGGPARR